MAENSDFDKRAEEGSILFNQLLQSAIEKAGLTQVQKDQWNDLENRFGNLEISEFPKERPKPYQDEDFSKLDKLTKSDYIWLPQPKSKYTFYHPKLEKDGIPVAKQNKYYNQNWFDAHSSLQQEGLTMLTIKEFIDFLNTLKTDAHDLSGNKIPESERLEIYNEITQKKNPWRAEWLDSDFKVVNGILHINSNHRKTNGNLIPQVSEPLEDCVMQDCWVDLNLSNKQGLPTQKTRRQETYFWYPKRNNNSVARFFADTYGAVLSCYWNPSYIDAALAVRPSAKNF